MQGFAGVYGGRGLAVQGSRGKGWRFGVAAGKAVLFPGFRVAVGQAAAFPQRSSFSDSHAARASARRYGFGFRVWGLRITVSGFQEQASYGLAGPCSIYL